VLKNAQSLLSEHRLKRYCLVVVVSTAEPQAQRVTVAGVSQVLYKSSVGLREGVTGSFLIKFKPHILEVKYETGAIGGSVRPLSYSICPRH